MDGFVLLTPLLVLAVIALLGFTGCHWVFLGDRPEPPRTLTLQVRVPSSLTVTSPREFRWNRPGEDRQTSMQLEVIDDGSGTVVYQFVVPQPIPTGLWHAECQLRVNDGTANAQTAGVADFTLGDTDPLNCFFVFSTEGAPATNDFKITPIPGLACAQ
jgi:hypothetical protein